MKNQKVCIVGGGLAGLAVAYVLGKLNLKIDLFANDFYKDYQSLRTTAFSNSNCTYLKKLNLFNSSKEILWPCSVMKLYDIKENFKNDQVFDLNSDKKNNILYMAENKKIAKILKEKIKKNNKINIKCNNVDELFSKHGLKFIRTHDKKIYKYNLVILCTGKNSFLIKNFLGNRYFEHLYNEVSVVTTINHKQKKNNIVRQFFLNEGPLALLPISKNKTSLVWSVQKSTLQHSIKQKDFFVKERLQSLINNIYKNFKYSHNFEYTNLNFHLGYKYYNDRILIFGEGSHSIHPFVGQGFNMILRDLKKLEKIIKKQVELGLDIGNATLFNEYVEDVQSNNFVFSFGVRVVKKIFDNKNVLVKNLRNFSLKEINTNKFAKNFIFNLADKGINL